MMLPVADIAAVRSAVAEARRAGKSIGLVPTMGALHAGHASLLNAARSQTGFVVATIFINPTQFGPNEDLAKYPRTMEQDLQMCAAEGVDLVFVPEAVTIYPAGFQTFVQVEELQKSLCGAGRPGHFRGVATVVLKLFNIIQPDLAYLGQKDAQQARILQQMVSDLDLPVQIRVCPIVREQDGLALSSRNRYLDANQRRNATVLFRALCQAKSAIESGERSSGFIEGLMSGMIGAAAGAVLEYAVVVSADTLQPMSRLRGNILLAVAVKFGSTRLIDNLLLSQVGE
jgi:pantoate--beta-alanine ligase